MDEAVEHKNPFGILLLATFWMLLSIPFFYLSSFAGSYRWIVLVLTLIGTSFILIGWGLIILNKYAFFASFILALLGLVPNLYILPSLWYFISSGNFNPTFLLLVGLFLSFIPITIYHVKISSLYTEIFS